MNITDLRTPFTTWVADTTASNINLPWSSGPENASTVNWLAETTTTMQTEQFNFIQWINETLLRDRPKSRSSTATKTFYSSNFQFLPMSIFLGVNAVLGVIGNALLCFAANQPEISPHSYSVFLAWLGVSDSLALLLNVSKHFLWMKTIKKVPVFNTDAIIHVCRFEVFMTNFTTTLSHLLLVFVSVDRYIGIAHPLKKKLWCTHSRARCACAVAVVICVALSLPEPVKVNVATLGVLRMCSYPDAFFDYISYNFLLTRFVPCVVFFAFSVVTLRAIRTANRKRASLAASGVRSDDQPMLRTTMALLTIPIFSFLVTLPSLLVTALSYTVFEELIITEKHNDFQRILDANPYLSALATLNFSANFYLLLATFKACRAILCRLCVCLLVLRPPLLLLNPPEARQYARCSYVTGYKSLRLNP